MIAKARQGASLPGNAPQAAVGGYNPGPVPEPTRRRRQHRAGPGSLRQSWEQAPHPLPGGHAQVRPGEENCERPASLRLALVLDAALSSLSFLLARTGRVLDIWMRSPPKFSPALMVGNVHLVPLCPGKRGKGGMGGRVSLITCASPFPGLPRQVQRPWLQQDAPACGWSGP